MTDERDRTEPKPDAKTDSERARAARQAEALRANLRKRNAQRRERQAETPDSGSAGDGA